MIARQRVVRAASLFHGSRSERTFAAALAILGAVAAAQLLGALIIYLQHAPPLVPSPPHAATIAHPEILAPALPVVRPVKPAPASPLPRLTKTQSNPPATKRQTKSLPGAAPAVSVPDELLQVAKALRAKGDTGNAIAKLQQAIALAPQNADVLAELAMTYESMQLFDRSNEVWTRLKSLGAAAGPLGELAVLKLQLGVPVQGIPGSTGRSPTEPAAPNDTTGIPDDSSFGISQVTQTTVDDPDALTRMTLRVGVKKRPNTEIDYTKVKIQVFFYDVVDNDQVALTDADVNYEWVTPGHNWADTDTEVLDVTYLRPKKHYPVPGTELAAVPDSVEKATRARKSKGKGEELSSAEGMHQYLGYIVRVYYKEELQAVRADPTRLLNLFPPPFTAPPQ
ncbi:MAG: tetratricopeptide repeat protein [Chthoniobacterales bacterium]|nr:tetratricopeptide repeat protein [Chthoniobacterales bacterium]